MNAPTARFCPTASRTSRLRSRRGRRAGGGSGWLGLGLRWLLILSLLLASGPWATVLAATPMPDCQHTMSTSAAPMVHADKACPACVHGSSEQRLPDGGQQPCGQHGSACGGACALLCGVAWPLALTTALMLASPQPSVASLIVAVSDHIPTPTSAAALRPPISA